MKNQILKLAAMMVLPAALLAFTSCSSTPQSQTATDLAMRGGIVVDTVTATATVQSINARNRTVVLQRPDGSLMTYECGPDVLNFNQIKVGDQVTGEVADAVAFALMKGYVPPAAGTASVVVRAPLGAKPGGKMVHTVGFTATVLGVDAANHQVNLQLVDGTTQTIKVGPDINLSDVKPGDNVGVRLTRAIMITVTPPAKTAP